MITQFATNRAPITTSRNRVIPAATVARRAAATPVFADVSRFAEPSATRMVWMPTTSGQHPSFV